MSHQETTKSLFQNGIDKDSIVHEKPRRRKNKLRISSSSSEFTPENNNDTDTREWTLVYNKQFACRLCKYITSNQSDILNHTHVCHKKMKKIHHIVFKKDCLVQLPKLESKPNMTGLSSIVVLDKRKIIEHVNNNYCIVYSSKTDNYSSSENLDSGDDNMFLKKKRKRFRLCSQSSNETVVVHPDEDEQLSVVKPENSMEKRNTDSEIKNNIYECIKIEDSSESDSDQGNISEKNKSNTKLLQKHQETIQRIISVSKNNIFKNIDDSSVQITHGDKNQSNNMESQLKHKLLSIGRKIINKQGFNCIGLLRYLEHKNLDITWIPKLTVHSKFNTDYIRIMTKLKDNIVQDDTGWKSLPANGDVRKNTFFCIPNPPTAIITKFMAESNIESTLAESVLSNNVSYSSTQSKNKLLNKSPVANPKQLPKKMHIIETKSNDNSKMLTTTQNKDPAVCFEITEDNRNENTFMPIMTSVTSLAFNYHKNSNNNETADTNATKVNTDSPIGRIKVKPVSELMSERVLNNIKEQTSASTAHEPQNNIAVYQVPVEYIPSTQILSPVVPIQTLPVPNTSNNNALTTSKTPSKNADCVILDTVELPNTRTDAPFKYLQNLLQIHNIILLDTKEILETNFKCLIKFKVKYKQESKDQPVILCLSLFCYNNSFCIKVNDRNQENIDMGEISANWQWEIIKIFTGETVNKLLQNAEKISKEVFDYTKSFCCLLKSINVIKNV